MSNRSQRNRKKTSLSSLVLVILLAVAFYVGAGRLQPEAVPAPTAAPSETALSVDRPGEKETVLAYLQEHHRLPDYYITKAEASALGWKGGSLEPYAPGRMIGGDRFGNYEGLLPNKSGRRWTEADIGTMGQPSRGSKRMVFSSDGLIYYTEDHYASFEKLGEME